jgi:pimeloyl-ACP methyl ester carboxylesterase
LAEIRSGFRFADDPNVERLTAIHGELDDPGYERMVARQDESAPRTQSQSQPPARRVAPGGRDPRHPVLGDIRAGLEKVRVPSLVLGCDGDVTEGEGGRDSRRLAAELPDAAVWWLPGCGHYVQFARPEKVVEAVRHLAGV